MPTPSLFPYLLKAVNGPAVQTFTSEPITLDIDASNAVSLVIIADAIGIDINDIPITLDLDTAVITAQMAGTLEIAVAPISLEID